MMFQLGFLLALPLGYFLCYGHAKLSLWLYARSEEGRKEEADRLHAIWVQTHPSQTTPVEPSSTVTDGRTLSEQWNLPTRTSASPCEPLSLRHPGLIRTRRCPDGFSAAQVLGYTNIGRPPTPSLYSGGINAWPY